MDQEQVRAGAHAVFKEENKRHAKIVGDVATKAMANILTWFSERIMRKK